MAVGRAIIFSRIRLVGSSHLLLFLLGVAACSGDGTTPDDAGEAAAVVAAPGRIEGTIRFMGRVPDADTPDNAGSLQPMLVVDAADNGLKFAVVYLLGIDAQDAPESQAETPNVDQQELAFEPHVTAVRAGQEMLFSNSDPENHNIRAQTQIPRNGFNIVTSSGLEYDKAFEVEPDYAPILLACDIHAWMRGWVYVFDHPYFAVTDAHGRFSIGPLPEGSYRVRVRQPDGRLRAEGNVRVEAGRAREIEVVFTRDDLFSQTPRPLDDE